MKDKELTGKELTTKELKEKELRIAASEGNSTKVKELLGDRENSNIDINSTSRNGNLALNWALERGSIGDGNFASVIFGLLAHGSKINDKAKQLIASKFKGSSLLTIADQESFAAWNNDFPGYFKFLYHHLSTADFEKREAYSILMLEIAMSIRTLACITIMTSEYLNDIFQASNNIKILSLACGETTEFLPLCYALERVGKKVDWYGVDHDAEFINNIRKKYGDKAQAITADATNIDALINAGLEPMSFDIIFLRNPDFEHCYNTFSKILSDIIPLFIKSTGKVYLSFTNMEAELYFPKNKHHYDPLMEFTRELKKEHGIALCVNGRTMTTHPDITTRFLNVNPSYLLQKKAEREAALAKFNEQKTKIKSSEQEDQKSEEEEEEKEEEEISDKECFLM